MSKVITIDTGIWSRKSIWAKANKYGPTMVTHFVATGKLIERKIPELGLTLVKESKDFVRPADVQK